MDWGDTGGVGPLKLRFAVENIGDIDHYMPASVDIGVPYVMTGDLHDLASAINFQECKNGIN